MPIKTEFTCDNAYFLVDLSYVVHALAFRTLNIYKRHFDVPKDPKELWKINFADDDDFMDIFTKNFCAMVRKLTNKHFIPIQNTVYCVDCKKKDIWRRSYFADYKLHRMDTEPEGLRRAPIFDYVIDVLLPMMEETDRGRAVFHPLAEGDDVIAIAVHEIRKKHPNAPILIIGSDGDLLQLVDTNVTIITTREEVINDRFTSDPRKDLLLKIIQGDKSDNIPSVFEKTKGDPVLYAGCGQKTAMRLINDPELLKEKIREFPEAAERFKTNQKIVDFTKIPESIVDDIQEKLEAII